MTDVTPEDFADVLADAVNIRGTDDDCMLFAALRYAGAALDGKDAEVNRLKQRLLDHATVLNDLGVLAGAGPGEVNADVVRSALMDRERFREVLCRIVDCLSHDDLVETIRSYARNAVGSRCSNPVGVHVYLRENETAPGVCRYCGKVQTEEEIRADV